MHDEHDRPDHETAVGEVEHRPVDLVEVEEIADAVEDDAVVEVADGPAEDHPQRGTEPTVGLVSAENRPTDDSEGRDKAYGGKDLIGRTFMRAPESEQRPVVYAWHDRSIPLLQFLESAIAGRCGRVILGGKTEPAWNDFVIALKLAFPVKPVKHAVFGGLIRGERKHGQ